jgi:hypothetical protein
MTTSGTCVGRWTNAYTNAQCPDFGTKGFEINLNDGSKYAKTTKKINVI